MVRREQPTDQDEARATQIAAFRSGDSEPIEARLLDQLRRCDGWLPELSLVAEIEGKVVGHNVCTRGYVDATPCVGLGPIGIAPDRQRSGVGSALMWAMIGAADAMGEPLIALLGNPDYYSRFGFKPSTAVGIEPPDEQWGPFFQVLPLTNWAPSINGLFRYSAPFDDLD